MKLITPFFVMGGERSDSNAQAQKELIDKILFFTMMGRGFWSRKTAPFNKEFCIACYGDFGKINCGSRIATDNIESTVTEWISSLVSGYATDATYEENEMLEREVEIEDLLDGGFHICFFEKDKSGNDRRTSEFELYIVPED